VIAGDAFGLSARIDTRVPILMVHFTVQPGANVSEVLPAGSNGFVYVFRGSAKVGSNRLAATEGQVAVFAPGEGGAYFESHGREPLEALLLAGTPLNEPIARYGPFVMNTKAEIQQAFEDYRNGKLGTIE
jgi:redox-sensitive bicupin YhaK (pirin superfamily)